jgi:ElaA protein
LIEIKSYLNLSKDELFEILRLRTNIFVVEQNCPYPELDDYDKISYHLLAQKENKMVGTLRIIEFENEVKIGRVAIHQEFRKLGLGKKIMLEAHDFIKSQFPKKQIRISAQQYLEKFYGDLGYEFTGKKYLEDDIPHMEMIKKP